MLQHNNYNILYDFIIFSVSLPPVACYIHNVGPTMIILLFYYYIMYVKYFHPP